MVWEHRKRLTQNREPVWMRKVLRQTPKLSRKLKHKVQSLIQPTNQKTKNRNNRFCRKKEQKGNWYYLKILKLNPYVTNLTSLCTSTAGVWGLGFGVWGLGFGRS